MRSTKIKAGDWECRPVGSDATFRIKRDFYRGGWFIWNSAGLKFSEMRFETFKLARIFLADKVAA
ncbi:MAG: hypothetical protein AAFR84_00900 [Pseudomonadota bacterium]